MNHCDSLMPKMDDTKISLDTSNIVDNYENENSFSSPELKSSLNGSCTATGQWHDCLLRSQSQDDYTTNNHTISNNATNIIITDNIHGYISVPSVLQAIIDTPQFDRLRSLRMSGFAHYVYPAAKHSRWEHSLGVMHLAGKFFDKIQRDYPADVDDVDKICVMMAGLCHDLGHGSFSHLWETFVAEARPKYVWHHEQSSIDMLEFLIDDNNLMPVFYKHGLIDRDIVFVKEMINFPDTNALYEGRGPEKHFLYEVVANKVSGVDVDKWDYILRDNAAFNVGITFDYTRFILNSAILDVGGKKRLCFRDKEVDNIQEMFLDRARLHRKGYQHRVIKVIDRMVLDAMLAADPFLFCVRSRDGSLISLSKACDDPYTHAQLSDEFIIKTIQTSVQPELEEARDILKRITKRNLYKPIGMVDYNGSLGVKQKEMETGLQERMEEGMKGEGKHITLVKRTIDMGMGKKNPLEKILFYDKKGRTRVIHEDRLKKMIPEEMSHETVFVVCRIEAQDVVEAATRAFVAWSENCFRTKDCAIKLAD